jgi:hypothetical protein
MQGTYLLLGDRSNLKAEYLTELISTILRTQRTRDGERESERGGREGNATLSSVSYLLQL